MLNENDLSQILGAPVSVKVSDIHWKSQDSSIGSLLFYRLKSDDESQKRFKERLNKAQFSWLVVNQAHPDLPSHSTVIDEEKWPRIQKQILDKLYPLPVLKLIAITGTNGKTTTTDLVLQLGTLMGKKGISLGTLGVRENQKSLLDFGLTSPCLIDMRKFLHRFGLDKDFCVMEVSSHALAQDRVHGLEFDVGGWLSFTQDHLDFHLNMEEYFASKCLLLTKFKEGAKLFFPREQFELYSKVVKLSDHCMLAPEIKGMLPVFFQAQFNRNNLEVAVAVLEHAFKECLPKKFDILIPPDGRFYIRAYKNNFLVVDSAHTPDALENICRAIREGFPKHRLKVLFGCGGDRDRKKRPLMGSVVEKWADEIYVTSDNPRSEDPADIMGDIVKGITHKEFHYILERPMAVQTAFADLNGNEILLLAGKGAEDYILIKGVKHPYSDIAEVEMFLARNKND